MKKKFFSVAMCLCVMVFVSLVFVGCNDNPTAQSTPVHDSKAWFTESELSSVGLSGLKAPSGCTGEIYTDENNAWGEMVFNQDCESVDIMTQNAQTILNYFTQNYGGKFGYAERYASTIDNDKFYYNINLSTDLNDYFDDNPSPMYTFYYILNLILTAFYFVLINLWRCSDLLKYNTLCDNIESRKYLFPFFDYTE